VLLAVKQIARDAGLGPSSVIVTRDATLTTVDAFLVELVGLGDSPILPSGVDDEISNRWRTDPREWFDVGSSGRQGRLPTDQF